MKSLESVKSPDDCEYPFQGLETLRFKGFLRKGMPYQTFSRKGMPYQSFSRKGMPSRAAASDDQVYVGNVALLLFKYATAVHYWDISDCVDLYLL